MSFQVGQKVACVDASPCRGGCCLCPLVEGKVYTITHINPDPDQFGDIGVELFEVSPPKSYFHQPGFRSTRFRPVVERKTDTGMAILTKILDGVRDKSPACTETAI